MTVRKPGDVMTSEGWQREPLEERPRLGLVRTQAVAEAEYRRASVFVRSAEYARRFGRFVFRPVDRRPW
jgi:hypothetical protein